VAGTVYDAGALDPTNDCQSCQPLVSSRVFSPIADGTPCALGICAAGACVSDRCFLDAQLVAAGTAAPGGLCLSCQPEASLSAYSVSPDTSPCSVDGGNFCQAGSCELRCLIDGGLLMPDAGSPNGCQACDPLQPLAWSSLADGTRCIAGGNYCLDGGCTPACLIDAGLVMAGAFRPGDPSGCCDPARNDSAYTFLLLLSDAGQATLSIPRWLSAGHFNGLDGGVGLVLRDDSQAVLFLPLGDGGFAAGQLLGDAGSYSAPVVADFNGDHIDDVALLVPGGIALFMGRPTGPPIAGPVLSGPASASWLTVARTVGSTYPDLATVGGDELWVFHNNGGAFGNGMFRAYIDPTTSGLVSGDFNGDGQYDLALFNTQGICVMLGFDGGFVDGGQWHVGAARFTGSTVADLDGDGFGDLVFSYPDTNGNTPIVEYRGSAGSLTPGPTFDAGLPFGSSLSGVTAVQFSQEALPGLAMELAAAPGDPRQVLLQLPAGKTSDAGTALAFASVGDLTSGLTAADFDGDGQTDLAVGLADGGFVILWGQCP
jgi:hypothetical protein